MKKSTEFEKLTFSELLLNKVNLIIISCDENGQVTYVSPAAENIIGYKVDSLLGERWWDLTFFSKEEGQFSKNRIFEIVSGKTKVNPKPYDRKLLCKDGSLKWIEWRDSFGVNNIFVSVGVDITEWKKTEKIKIQSETILNSVDSMLMVSDTEGNIIYASPSVEKMLGYRADEVMGGKWWKLTYENRQEALQVKEAIYNYVFLNKKDFIDISKRKIKTANGDYKWIEWQLSKGDNGTYISIGTDITQRIATEIELKKAKELAEQSLKVKNEFLANMSHEIRTPLNAVIGFTDLLLESQITEEQRSHLETMRNSGEILLSLINNVLDLSKLESDKLKIEEIPFDLHKSFNNILKLMKLKSDEKGISLDLKIEPNTPIQVIGDPTRLEQILLNLIGNAVKFTNKGSVHINVKQLNETADTSEIYFEVRDTGIGILSNKINTVFGAFSQAKSDTSRIYGGTGLGLTIVKKLVVLLNGVIKVESKFGEGSVFKITLPLKKDLENINLEEKGKDIFMEEPLELSILLVEDNKTNQLLAKTRLERWKCKVDIANNGIEGVKKAQQKIYDLILMDIQMPVMDGYEATKIIKNDISKKAAGIPVIAMTAYATNADIKRAKNSGMDDYIFKPFKPKEFYAILEKYGKPSKERNLKYADVNIGDTETTTEKKHIDLNFLYEETQHESSILILLIESFLKDLEEFFEVVNIEYKNKNWKVLYEATHKIKPSITMFGISEMGPVIHLLAQKFREEKQLEDVGELLNSFKEIYKFVKDELLIELKLLKNE
ncbi:PAS domain S-box protein [Lutibacter sp.]|uniref:PAS domain S-box protein n=1 Tax=Lutibacter sp. TaxID=1925666 RepID=UPI0035686C0B